MEPFFMFLRKSLDFSTHVYFQVSVKIAVSYEPGSWNEELIKLTYFHVYYHTRY